MAKFGTRAVRQVAGAFTSCIAILLLGNQPGSTEPAKTADDGRRIHTFSGVPIRLPRFLSNPKAYSLSPNTVVHLVRTPADTCGLYTWGVFKMSSGEGPPPHIHYADQEWFLTEQQGGVRIFLPRHKTAKLVPGQIPGINAPVQPMGSALIPPNSAVYSPKAIVHYYTNESGQTIDGFHNVWEPGFGIIKIFEIFDQATRSGQRLSNDDLLKQTGLWGVPHSGDGSMTGTTQFRLIRDPIARLIETNLKQLQELIDRGERCFPGDH